MTELEVLVAIGGSGCVAKNKGQVIDNKEVVRCGLIMFGDLALGSGDRNMVGVNQDQICNECQAKIVRAIIQQS